MSDLNIYAGYTLNNRFFTLEPSTSFGYCIANTFYSHDCEQDLSQYPGACPVVWTQREGYSWLSPESKFVFCFNGQYFYSKQDAELQKANYIQWQNATVYSQAYCPNQPYQDATYAGYMYPRESYYGAPSQDTSQLTTRQEETAPVVQKQANLFSPLGVTIAPSQFAAATAIQKSCSICKQETSTYSLLFSNVCCIDCLFDKYEKNELFSNAKGVKTEWTESIIVEVHNFLNVRLPEEKKAKLPTEIRLPLGHFICFGQSKHEVPGYPQVGHIAGNLNKCAEDGCPNHEMCKTCAAQLLNCPICQSFIKYEELPTGCPEGCSNHKPSFTRPCPECKKVTERKKRVEEKKVEEKAD